MINAIAKIKDIIQGKVTLGKPRSKHWPKARAQHLSVNPKCAGCGGTHKLEVHHKMPFHLDPLFELDPTNLVTLCEAKKNGINCHLLIGHLGSFKSYNKDVVADAATIQLKITLRPKELT